MKRVVFFNPAAGLGGGERSLLTLLQALSGGAVAFSPHVLLGEAGPLEAAIRSLNVPVEVIPFPRLLLEVGDRYLSQVQGLTRIGNWLRFAPGIAGSLCAIRRTLRNRLRELDPAILHTNGMKAHILGALACPKNARLVWHLRDFVGDRRAGRLVLKSLARKVDLVIANSNAVGRDSAGILRNVPYAVVHNAVDTDRFSPGPVEAGLLDQLAGLPPAAAGTIRIGLIATYARWKGQDVFLLAASELRRMLPDAWLRFYVIGGPIYRTLGSQFSIDELRRLAEQVGVAESVGFIPFQEELPAVYRSLDIVAHCSTQREPFGLTIAEAMACGRPVVAAAPEGISELFITGREALGVSEMNASNLAQQIRALVIDSDLRTRMGSAARTAAEAKFAISRLRRELLANYDLLLAR